MTETTADTTQRFDVAIVGAGYKADVDLRNAIGRHGITNPKAWKL
jgi:hypothetical protein